MFLLYFVTDHTFAKSPRKGKFIRPEVLAWHSHVRTGRMPRALTPTAPPYNPFYTTEYKGEPSPASQPHYPPRPRGQTSRRANPRRLRNVQPGPLQHGNVPSYGNEPLPTFIIHPPTPTNESRQTLNANVTHSEHMGDDQAPPTWVLLESLPDKLRHQLQPDFDSHKTEFARNERHQGEPVISGTDSISILSTTQAPPLTDVSQFKPIEISAPYPTSNGIFAKMYGQPPNLRSEPPPNLRSEPPPNLRSDPPPNLRSDPPPNLRSEPPPNLRSGPPPNLRSEPPPNLRSGPPPNLRQYNIPNIVIPQSNSENVYLPNARLYEMVRDSSDPFITEHASSEPSPNIRSGSSRNINELSQIGISPLQGNIQSHSIGLTPTHYQRNELYPTVSASQFMSNHSEHSHSAHNLYPILEIEPSSNVGYEPPPNLRNAPPPNLRNMPPPNLRNEPPPNLRNMPPQNIRNAPPPNLRNMPPPNLRNAPPPNLRNMPPPNLRNAPPPNLRNMPPPNLRNAPPPNLRNMPPPNLRNEPPPNLRNAPPPNLRNAPPPNLRNEPPPNLRNEPNRGESYPVRANVFQMSLRDEHATSSKLQHKLPPILRQQLSLPTVIPIGAPMQSPAAHKNSVATGDVMMVHSQPAIDQDGQSQIIVPEEAIILLKNPPKHDVIHESNNSAFVPFQREYGSYTE